jgi:hypothetical protein
MYVIFSYRDLICKHIDQGRREKKYCSVEDFFFLFCFFIRQTKLDDSIPHRYSKMKKRKKMRAKGRKQQNLMSP